MHSISKIIAPKAKVESIQAVQGRFIVLPSSSHSLQIHEIFVDQQAAKMDQDGRFLNNRGSFEKVKENIGNFLIKLGTKSMESTVFT